MRRFSILIIILILFSVVLPASAQSNASIEINCPDGTPIRNGVEVIVNMRPGFTYTATALGVNGFDPIVGVRDQNGVGLCTDNDRTAGTYTVSLPTSGFVPNSILNSQVPFSHDFSSLADISLIVGNTNGDSGEFVLILEGMAVTSADGSGQGAGDPFTVRLTQNMVDSGVPITAYMISVTDDLDPLMQIVDADNNVVTLNDNSRLECDDAGDASTCWGASDSLADSYVSRTQARQLPGGPHDAMLSIALDGVTLDPDPDNNFLNYLMTSYQQSSFGDYIVAFDIGTGQGGGTNGSSSLVPTPSGTKPQQGQTTIPTPSGTKPNGNGNGQSAVGGVNATCPDGTEITNGVEILVSMRPGFTYTATALGINGFDPIVAVSDENGVGLCEDDNFNAVNYTASLPTTGFVPNARTNAQVPFSHNFSGFANISITVSDAQGGSGEFVLILEGMAFTSNDGSGDPFSVRLTPNMVSSGVPLTAYMISVTDDLDPLIVLVDDSGNILTDQNNQLLACDDAGDSSSCWGQSTSLGDAYVSRKQGRQLPGGPHDAMLSLVLDGLTLDPNPDNNFLKFLMGSFQQSTFGDYLVVFHIGVGSGGAKPNI